MKKLTPTSVSFSTLKIVLELDKVTIQSGSRNRSAYIESLVLADFKARGIDISKLVKSI